MNAKYALALILALQVSMSLCEVPQPSQELVDKYNAMKTTFNKRLLNAYNKLQAAAAPFVEQAGDTERGQVVRTFVEDLQTKPEFQTFVRVATGAAQEAGPLMDTVRTSALGLYEHYLRSHIGQFLDDRINQLKVYLDQVLPAE